MEDFFYAPLHGSWDKVEPNHLLDQLYNSHSSLKLESCDVHVYNSFQFLHTYFQIKITDFTYKPVMCKANFSINGVSLILIDKNFVLAPSGKPLMFFSPKSSVPNKNPYQVNNQKY